MADSGGEALRAFVPILHLPDDDKSTGDEIISNAGSVIEDFQRFFVLHFQLLIAHLVIIHRSPSSVGASLPLAALLCHHFRKRETDALPAAEIVSKTYKMRPVLLAHPAQRVFTL